RGEEGERQPGTDAGDRGELLEHLLLHRGEKAVEVEGVLLHHRADPDRHRLPGAGEAGQGEGGEVDPVTDPVDLDDRPLLRLLGDGAAKRSDHGAGLAGRATAGRSRSAKPGGGWLRRRDGTGEPRRCRWHTATARASVASARGTSCNPRKPHTARETASFAPAPPTPTARFTAAGAYSKTGRLARAATRSATPRAWPSTSALRALRKLNTPSTATAAGAWSARASVSRPNSSTNRRSSGAVASRRKTPCAPCCTPCPADSTTAQPRTRLPGSMPRTRVVPSTERTFSTGPGRPASSALRRPELLQLPLGDVGVGPDVLHVVVVLEELEELHHPARALSL